MFFNLAPSVMPFFLRIALRVEPFSNANCGYLIPTHHKLSLLLKGIHKKALRTAEYYNNGEKTKIYTGKEAVICDQISMKKSVILKLNKF